MGFCQGWTLGLISTYLQRFAPGGKVRAIGVDIQFGNLAKSTHAVLESVGVSVQQRLPGRTHARSMVAPTEPTLDLCFIDAAHNYGEGANYGVVHDYVEFAPYCKIAMFHDSARARACVSLSRRPRRSHIRVNARVHAHMHTRSRVHAHMHTRTRTRDTRVMCKRPRGQRERGVLLCARGSCRSRTLIQLLTMTWGRRLGTAASLASGRI